jgi:hypothetical protein
MKVKSRSEINESDKKRIPSEDRQETNGEERKVVEDQGSQKFPGEITFRAQTTSVLESSFEGHAELQRKDQRKSEGLGIRRG